MRTVLAIALCTAGCGRIGFDPLDDAGAGPVQSGTRLKAMWNKFEDGTRQYTGIYDTQLAVPCEIVVDPGPVYTCRPRAMPVVYTDASCTQKAGYMNSYLDQPFIEESDSAMQLHFYRAGASLGSGNFYEGTSCTGPFSGYPLYAFGPEVPLADFASLAVVDGTGARLTPSYYASADGFRAEAQLFDTELGIPCRPGDVEGGFACVPVVGADGSWATDPQCTQLFAAVQDGADANGAFAQAPDPAGCRLTDARFYRLGDPITPTTTYYAQSTGCVARTLPSGYHAVSLGAEVDLARLDLTFDNFPGHRIRLRSFVGGGIAWYSALSFLDTTAFDATLGEQCEAAVAVDGTLHCIPFGLLPRPENPLFSDATCTTKIDLAFDITWAGCAPSPHPYIDRQMLPSAADPTHHDLYTRGPEYTGSVYWNPGGCMQYSTGGEMNYLIGAQVAPSTFSAATVVIDP